MLRRLIAWLLIGSAFGCATPPTLELRGDESAVVLSGRAKIVALAPRVVNEQAVTRLWLALTLEPSDLQRPLDYELVVECEDGRRERVAKPFHSNLEAAMATAWNLPFVFEFELTPDDGTSSSSARVALTRTIEIRRSLPPGRDVDGDEPLPWTFELAATLEPRAIAREPSMEHGSRSGLATWTYLVVGFPRDLLDVPFTTLNRLGFASFGNESDGYDDGRQSSASATLFTTAYWGGVWYGAIHGIRAAGPHLAKKFAYATGYGVWHGLVVGGATAAGLLAYVGIAVPSQTALLRAPYDDRYLKAKRPIVALEGDWTAESVANWERDERSYAYFPNWRFGVRGERRVLPTANDNRIHVWVVRSLALEDVSPQPSAVEPTPADAAP